MGFIEWLVSRQRSIWTKVKVHIPLYGLTYSPYTAIEPRGVDFFSFPKNMHGLALYLSSLKKPTYFHSFHLFCRHIKQFLYLVYIALIHNRTSESTQASVSLFNSNMLTGAWSRQDKNIFLKQL